MVCTVCGKPATGSVNVMASAASSVPSRFEMRCDEHNTYRMTTDHRPAATEAPRLSASAERALDMWTQGKMLDMRADELAGLLMNALADLKTYRAAIERLTDERDEHAMECMRLQTEGAYDVGYQRGFERSSASLAAATARAEAAEEALHDERRLREFNAETLRIALARYEQAEAALASERATSERLVDICLEPSGDGFQIQCAICLSYWPASDPARHFDGCELVEALAQHARATEPAPRTPEQRWNDSVAAIRETPELHESILRSVMSSMELSGATVDRERSEVLFEQALSGPPLIYPGHPEPAPDEGAWGGETLVDHPFSATYDNDMNRLCVQPSIYGGTAYCYVPEDKHPKEPPADARPGDGGA